MLGIKQDVTRGANAASDLMRTYPKVTRRWWMKEFRELRSKFQEEEKAETKAAFKLAADRAERNKGNTNEV